MKKIYLQIIFGFLCSTALVGFAQAAAATGEGRQVAVEANWVDLKSSESAVVDLVILFFHDGNFDLYDDREPASTLLQRLVKRDFTGWQSLEAMAPGTVVALMNGPHEFPPDDDLFLGIESTRVVMVLDPSRHRYVTAFIGLRPSNDAFMGNENPYRLELFDLAGNDQFPLTIDFFGSDVLDAGVCANNESSLYFLDTTVASEQVCVTEDNVVRAHPGYNGSVRNPSGTPQRILGATGIDMGGKTGVRRYDEVSTDFSRAGAKIGRLVFTLEETVGSQAGSWYSPSRSGEGFNIDMYRRPHSDRDELIVYWYTYDSEGRPLWLIGTGGPLGPIQMYSAHGGRLASTTNPDNVEHKLWGTIRLALNETREFCPQLGAVIYTPADPAQSGGRYEIQRLTPRSTTSQRLCEQLYPDRIP